MNNQYERKRSFFQHSFTLNIYCSINLFLHVTKSTFNILLLEILTLTGLSLKQFVSNRLKQRSEHNGSCREKI